MRVRPFLVLLAAALLAAGCRAGPPSPTGDLAVDQRVGEAHADHADATSDGGAPVAAGASTTEATIAQLRAMDPERLASAHQHDGGDGSDHADHAAPRHPNGIDPHRIVIPAIDVDADVIDLGLQDDGTMEVPEDFAQTGWFDRGPQPGRVGPAVIAGHVDDRTGPAVFHELSSLDPGDVIEVHSEDGEVVTFAVREVQQHPKDDFPTEAVYAGTPGPELRLITCGGEFDGEARSYRDNTIVFAERVDA